MKYLILLSLLVASCLAATRRLAPGEEAVFYQEKIIGVTIIGKTIGGVYEPVTVIAESDPTAVNVSRWQEQALGRISWGLGLMIGGAVFAGLLKSYGLEQVGVWTAAFGAGAAFHGLLISHIAEWWHWAGLGTGIVFCGLVVYLFHGKGIGIKETLAKVRRRATIK